MAAPVGARERLCGFGQFVLSGQQQGERERAVGVAALVGSAIRRRRASDITALFEQHAKLRRPRRGRARPRVRTIPRLRPAGSERPAPSRARTHRPRHRARRPRSASMGSVDTTSPIAVASARSRQAMCVHSEGSTGPHVNSWHMQTLTSPPNRSNRPRLRVNGEVPERPTIPSNQESESPAPRRKASRPRDNLVARLWTVRTGRRDRAGARCRWLPRGRMGGHAAVNSGGGVPGQGC